uniref:Uncharacterized protein n=1 Tax=Triticum urartu TaxID=4572 RepID=A0A8R7V4H1_TRIUA
MKCKTEPSFAYDPCILSLSLSLSLPLPPSPPLPPPPPLSLSLSLSLSLLPPSLPPSLPLKQISQAFIAASLTHRPGGCHVSSWSLRCCQVPPVHCLGFGCGVAGNRKASDASSTPGGLVGQGQV